MRNATLLICVVFLSLAACQSIPSRSAGENAPVSPVHGDTARPTGSNHSERNHTNYLIETAERYFEISNFDKSLEFLLRLYDRHGVHQHNPKVLNRILAPTVAYRANSLSIRLSLEGHYDLNRGNILLDLKPSNSEQRLDALLLAAEIYELSSDFPKAVEALLSINPVPVSQEDFLSEKIWGLLSNLTIPVLEQLKNKTGNSNNRAWFTLAISFKAALSPYMQERIWAMWKSKNPSHLANIYPPSTFDLIPSQPKSIALMIPITGQLGTAGTAIRDGFISAYLSQESELSNETNEQEIRIYDTSQSRIESVVIQALRDGANAFVGPLDKRKVRELLAMNTGKPTVALNRVDSLRPPFFSATNSSLTPSHHKDVSGLSSNQPNNLQLSLSIEDDVGAISQKLISENNKRVAVFYGTADWCDRAVEIFRDFSRPSIQIVTETQLLDLMNITRTVGSSLLIDKSSDRNGFIQRALGIKTEFTPRRREDIDAVVAFMDSSEFETLAAALSFHFAKEVPIFTTSSAVSSGRGLQGIQTINFTDMPWNLYASDLKSDFTSAFKSASESQALYALGVDAFRVVNQISSSLLNTSIDGSTGKLIIRNDGVIIRKPAWGQLRNKNLK